MLKRFGMVSVAFVLALVLSGCGKPRVTINEARLEPQEGRTLVHLHISVPSYGNDAWTMQPTFEATLRDNLGNEYKAIGGTESLNKTIASGILFEHEASGTIIFPVIDPKAEVVRLTIPLRRYRSELADALLLGFSGPAHTIHVGAVWIAGPSGFVLGTTYAAEEDGSLLAVGTN